MIEVLVSIILLSIGVLSLIGLQAWALRSNQQARYQAAAVRLGRELGELMRSNPSVSSINGAGDPYLITAWSGAASTHSGATNCAANLCTQPTDMANWDIQEWYARATTELPGIQVTVCYDSQPYDANGLPQWPCTGTNAATPVVKIGWTTASTARDANAVLTAQATPGVIVPVGIKP